MIPRRSKRVRRAEPAARRDLLGAWAAHNTATAGRGNADMDATDGHYGELVCTVRWSMHLQQHTGTGQLPLAGAILCCTALPHEQRVGTPYIHSAQAADFSHRRSSQPLARRWARPSSSTSHQT